MSQIKIRHPAQYSKEIVPRLVELLDAEGVRGLLLDPFAGPGRSLHEFMTRRRRVLGIEIEQAWVTAGNYERKQAGFSNDRVELRQGDAMATGLRGGSVAAFVTSPCYGNRFSDHHNARDASRRRSYTHDMRTMLNNPNATLEKNNAGTMRFDSDEYQWLHYEAYREMWRVVKDGGIGLLNVSDFIEDRRQVNSATWHLRAMQAIGWRWERAVDVETPRFLHGENRELRVDREWVFQFRKVAS